MKTIYLEKQSRTDKGLLPYGHIYTWTYKTTDDTNAIRRARAALLRDHPDENELAWKQVRV